jgi:hypothetical protein
MNEYICLSYINLVCMGVGFLLGILFAFLLHIR